MKSKNKNESKAGYIKLLVLIIIVLVYFVFTTYFFSIIQVNGNSMNNELFNNAICIIDNSDFKINRYDIVIAKMTNTKSIKRVIGIPNDVILIKNGSVFINGEIGEKYNFYTENKGLEEKEIFLKENEYFLLGDNRKVSYDSREYGIFTEEKIKGKLIKVLWKGK